MSRKKTDPLPDAEDAARAVVKHYFGRAPRRLKHMTAGKTNFVFEAKTADGVFIIRLSDAGDKLSNFIKEQWAAARAAEAGVPVPEILEVGSAVVPFTYMIQRKIEGTEALNHVGSTKEILRQMGEHTARIHTIPTTGFGPTFDWSENKLSKNKTWKAYLREELGVEHRLDVLERHARLSPAAFRRLKASVRKLEGWQGKTTLAHGDMRLKNVIADERDCITAIIDWEECHSAPAMLWDLSIALHDLGVDGKQAFLEGYGLPPKEYVEIAPLVKALNFLHYAPAIERIVGRKDKARLAFYQLRLGGVLDLFSL